MSTPKLLIIDTKRVDVQQAWVSITILIIIMYWLSVLIIRKTNIGKIMLEHDTLLFFYIYFFLFI